MKDMDVDAVKSGFTRQNGFYPTEWQAVKRRRRRLVRPNKQHVTDIVGNDRGGFFNVLGADDDSESDGKATLEEPLVDTDVEVSS